MYQRGRGQNRTLEKSVYFCNYSNSKRLLTSAKGAAASLQTAAFDLSSWPNSRDLEVISIQKNSWQEAFFWWVLILTIHLLSSLIPAPWLNWRSHICGGAWATGRWNWEIAVAILLQVKMVSVGGTAASTQEKKKDNMKSLTLVDISDQRCYIYGIIIYYFGLYLLSQFWLLHFGTCSWKANLMLLFFLVNISNIFFPETFHHYRNAIISRMLTIFVLCIYRI